MEKFTQLFVQSLKLALLILALGIVLAVASDEAVSQAVSVYDSITEAKTYDEPTIPPRILIDRQEIKAIPINNELLPLREIVEHIGGTVSWDSSSRRITITIGRRTVRVRAGSYNAVVNGNQQQITVPLQNIDSTTAVSLCFLADTLGLGVGYKNNTFILSTNPATRIAVVTYHHILPDEKNTHFRDNIWTISTQHFEEQMRYLYEGGYYTPTLDELEAFIMYGHRLPENSVMIHFDDGYYSNYVYAYPILQRYGLKAVLFAITAESEALGDYQPPINHRILQWASAYTLRQGKDVWETASHTHNLHGLATDERRTLLVTETNENIVEDALRSFDFVSNHRAFAYPKGQFNDTVVAALQEAGITMAFTVLRGYITPASDPMRLRRFMIYTDTTLAEFQRIVRG